MMALLEIRDLYVDLGEFSLRGASLAVEKGKYCCLIGDSGAGKSILLETIIGSFNPLRGQILLHGQDITKWSPERRKMGIVYQDYMLFPHLNIFDNIAFGMKLQKMSRKQVKTKVCDISARLGIENLLHRDINTLSGGEQQRAALARALVADPKVLLLDEAFSALDVASRERMRSLLRQLVKDLDVTVLHVTHDMEDVWALADQVAVLHDGQILQTGSPEHVFNCPRPGFVAHFLGARNILQGRVLDCDPSGLTHIEAGKARFYSIDHAPVGQQILVSVRPEELGLAREQPRGTLRNHLPAEIVRMERRGPLVWVTGQADGFCLQAAVTVMGAREQDLKPGDTAIFSFSATSLRIIEQQKNAPSRILQDPPMAPRIIPQALVAD
ncbi:MULTISPECIES: ABC transporter ATP-binding protein [Syntrophotalea]|jgi:molybdate transport system ATP-binding protein|uniref:ABC transporter ATP-binding protein n=1 Tax=Syntrophotalea acetylenica TaxID=29542 RepID=A0A1L3GGE5_SYNAC|nr:ATP-binding cassette domain-containing protein [Syntrophotalea acetylenica]APG24997.1 ABC transporter ATP-binding protein [Syntrophotalea acetylenica]APG43065.1 ABC transporter ATP-binding protein [Syntrophotalea acetylenica]MDY0261017.1 ATP-binding cassette domain-containing protein [Syntrophotalea acetylenica]